jgi:hypothetical protein
MTILCQDNQDDHLNKINSRGRLLAILTVNTQQPSFARKLQNIPENSHNQASPQSQEEESTGSLINLSIFNSRTWFETAEEASPRISQGSNSSLSQYIGTAEEILSIEKNKEISQLGCGGSIKDLARHGTFLLQANQEDLLSNKDTRGELLTILLRSSSTKCHLFPYCMTQTTVVNKLSYGNWTTRLQASKRSIDTSKLTTSEVQSKMIFMGHQISSCHVPVVRSFFIL